MSSKPQYICTNLVLLYAVSLTIVAPAMVGFEVNGNLLLVGAVGRVASLDTEESGTFTISSSPLDISSEVIS